MNNFKNKLPTTIKPLFALVKATFILLGSFKKPIPSFLKIKYFMFIKYLYKKS